MQEQQDQWECEAPEHPGEAAVLPQTEGASMASPSSCRACTAQSQPLLPLAHAELVLQLCEVCSLSCALEMPSRVCTSSPTKCNSSLGRKVMSRDRRQCYSLPFPSTHPVLTVRNDLLEVPFNPGQRPCGLRSPWLWISTPTSMETTVGSRQASETKEKQKNCWGPHLT